MTDPRDRQMDLDAHNRDFQRYEQVEKRQDYRLAEARDAAHDPGERFDEEFATRTVSMRQAPEALAHALGTALQEIGFCVLTDHGVDPALYRDAAGHTLRMLRDTPTTTKQRFRARRHGSINQGWFPLAETSDIHPDQVEGWVLCRRAFDLGERHDYDPAAFWPDPAFERAFRPLCLAHEALILPIMQAVLRFLGVDPHACDTRLTQTNFALRLNHYPPISTDAPAGAGRLLGHEDVTLFTLLPAPTIEGLQVLHRGSFAWVRLHAPPGSLILNTGDYMQRLTNDRLPSTTHRVSPPRDPAQRVLPRVSFPMNVYLWEDEVIEVLPGLGPPKYPPVRAEDFHVRITEKYYGDGYAD
ncbi:MAG: 2OG-Fe(II) oxygenase family protein [Planctomycetota bacterium]